MVEASLAVKPCNAETAAACRSGFAVGVFLLTELRFRLQFTPLFDYEKISSVLI